MHIPIEEFISGDKFIDLANHKFNTLNNKESFPVIPLPNLIIYCHTELVHKLFVEILFNDPFVLISHNGDGRVTDRPQQHDCGIDNIPDNLIHWYAANLRVKHHKITAIPTGLENRCWFPEINKHNQVYITRNTEKKPTNLCYMNFNINTNPPERSHVYNLFCNKSWVTTDMRSNGCDFTHYINNIHSHTFILCPEGNPCGHMESNGATGSHRFWEALYVNSIPIVKRGIHSEFFQDFPVVLINNWEEITEQFLQDEYNRIVNMSFDENKLTMQYWHSLITQHYKV